MGSLCLILHFSRKFIHEIKPVCTVRHCIIQTLKFNIIIIHNDVFPDFCVS